MPCCPYCSRRDDTDTGNEHIFRLPTLNNDDDDAEDAVNYNNSYMEDNAELMFITWDIYITKKINENQQWWAKKKKNKQVEI